MSTEALRQTGAGRLDHLPRALYLVLGAWVLGLTLGNFVFLLLAVQPSGRGGGSFPIWYVLLFSALSIFCATQVHISSVRLAFLLFGFDLLVCSTGLAGDTMMAWALCLLTKLSFGGLLMVGGWSTSRRMRIFALFVLVAGIEARYLARHYWNEAVKPYRSVISSGASPEFKRSNFGFEQTAHRLR